MQGACRAGPAKAGRHQITSVRTHIRRVDFDADGLADEIDRQPHGYDEQLLRNFAERYFPDGCGPTMDLQTCMFTNTPDHHFVIDVHPDYPQVSIASPCSGHGFKFASVVGEIMADLAEVGLTRHDISLFRLERLQRPADDQSWQGDSVAPLSAEGPENSQGRVG